MTRIDLAWGIGGAQALRAECDVLVLIDVLSFTTCVSIATTRGAVIRPYDGNGDLALAPGEILAGPRGGSGPNLSPESLVGLRQGERLVLGSPNGAAVAASLDGTRCVAAALRNASAVASWLGEQQGRIGFVAAGEHDDDGRWRPAYEDLVGAGAVIRLLNAERTPQAEAAVVGFDSAAGELADRLRHSRSGADLVARDFAGDVALAGELDADPVVPVLRDGAFVAAS